MTAMATEQRENVSFDQVAIGDRLAFVTRDTGCGRGLYERTGTVTRKTANTVLIRTNNWEYARLTRNGWRERAVQRVAER